MPAATPSDPEPPPPIDLRVVHRPRTGLVAAGAATFGASYGAAFFAGLALGAVDCSNCDKAVLKMGVPVAGPLLFWAWMPSRSQVPVIWPLLWSGVEAVGAALLIVGLVGHDVVERRVPDAWPRVSLVPSFTPQRGALSLNVSW